MKDVARLHLGQIDLKNRVTSTLGHFEALFTLSIVTRTPCPGAACALRYGPIFVAYVKMSHLRPKAISTVAAVAAESSCSLRFRFFLTCAEME